MYIYSKYIFWPGPVADIYDALDSMLEEEGVTCQCVGGGKIKHDAQAKTIEVFGKSQVLFM